MTGNNKKRSCSICDADGLHWHIASELEATVKPVQDAAEKQPWCTEKPSRESIPHYLNYCRTELSKLGIHLVVNNGLN